MPIGNYVSASGDRSAIAFFRYEWTGVDGKVVTFEVMDRFLFAPESTAVVYLDLVYDTHPVRMAGGKYGDE
jgi:hypothetical protein